MEPTKGDDDDTKESEKHALSNALQAIFITVGVVGFACCAGIAAFMIYIAKRPERGEGGRRKRTKMVEMGEVDIGTAPTGTSPNTTGNKKLQLISYVNIKKDIGIGM